MTNRHEIDETRLQLRYTMDGEPHWARCLSSLDACQRAYIGLYAESDLCGFTLGGGEIFDQFGQYVARVTLDGRLWPALPWTKDMKPLAEAPEL